MSVVVKIDKRTEWLIEQLELHFKKDADKIFAVKAVAEISDLIWRKEQQALNFGLYVHGEVKTPATKGKLRTAN